MKRSAGLFLVLALALGADSAFTGLLSAYGVMVLRAPWELPGDEASHGRAGIYLGRGLVLTAAHVAGQGGSLIVVGDGRRIPARLLKAGEFKDTDVSLLALEPAEMPRRLAALPPLRLCRDPPVMGEFVSVVDYRWLTYSVIVPPEILPPGVSWKFSSLIHDVENTGNSGSGVFSLARRCLMGIMSRKIEQRITDPSGAVRTLPVAKYFVPAAEIRDFLGAALE